MEKEKIKFEGKDYEIYDFGNPMFHEDWHEAEKLGLVYVRYNHYGPDYGDDTLTFCKAEEKEIIDKYFDQFPEW